jgi:hypothetical protein
MQTSACIITENTRFLWSKSGEKRCKKGGLPGVQAIDSGERVA